MVGKARFPLGSRTTAVNQTRLHAASLGMSFPVLSQFLPCSLLPDTSTRSSDSRAGKGGQPALECRLQGLGAPDAECRFSLAKNQAFSAQPPRVQSIYPSYSGKQSFRRPVPLLLKDTSWLPRALSFTVHPLVLMLEVPHEPPCCPFHLQSSKAPILSQNQHLCTLFVLPKNSSACSVSQ